MSEESERTDDWEEAVKHILELGKADIDNKAIMRQLGQMAGSYYLGLIDAGVLPDDRVLPYFMFLQAVARAKKDGLI